ncbi:probable cytochrome P450 6a13 [Leptopilina boulardi]|uniref:probable cytochrome P450 6a13 n=1 Tax=Leptopilina boulardi TaxID=63433 RepID=UPI0021F50E9A|nr:probable cytochrome P450 6a13 [Leptopilina boulardi]
MWIIFQLLWDPFFLLGLLLATIYYYFTATFDFWAKKNVPFRKPIIFFGNFKELLLFRKSQPEGILEIYNWFKNEDYFGVFRVRTPSLIIKNPELIKDVFVKDFANFSNRGIPINNTDPLMGNLFNLEGEKWKGLKSKLTPAFSPSKIKGMFYLLEECAGQLEKIIINVTKENESIVDTRVLAANYTIDVIGTCAFGIQTNAINSKDCEFKTMARKLSKSSLKTSIWRMLRPAMPTLFKILGVQMIDPEVTKFFKSVVSQVIKQRENQELKRHDFMDLLIELKNKGTLEADNKGKENHDDEQLTKKIELDEDTITAQAFVFFVAGYDTSANVISFCLHELALNSEIQEITRRDILDTLEKYDGKLTYDAIQEMKYLDMVVSETLRKYPLSPLLSRKCEGPYKIPGTEIELPAGMRVIIPIYGLHHDANNYPDPEIFDPERFNEENKKKRHPFVYLPFGDGPRGCIGQRFAYLQTKMGIITFLRNHRVELCEKSAIPLIFSRRNYMTSSEKGIWLKIVSITN